MPARRPTRTPARQNKYPNALSSSCCPNGAIKTGRRASRTACDAERRTIVKV
ncbi:DUF1534 domain-containing protein, partial [Pseudomonas sp. ST1]